MKTHVSHLLSAYIDHELATEQVLRVEMHLRECPACQKELRDLQALSSLLAQTKPELPPNTIQRFSVRLEKRASQRSHSDAQRLLRAAWNLFPFSLAGIWGVIQAIFLIALVLQFALQSGLLSNISALLPPADASLWTKAAQMQTSSGIEQIGQFVLQILTFQDPLLQGALIYLLLQFGLATLFAAWLAGWWLSKTRTPSNILGVQPG